MHMHMYGEGWGAGFPCTAWNLGAFRGAGGAGGLARGSPRRSPAGGGTRRGRRGPPRRHFSVALGQVDWVGVFSSCGLCPVQLGREISSKLMTRRLYFLFYFLTREIEYETTGLTLSASRRAQEGQTLCGGRLSIRVRVTNVHPPHSQVQ